MTTGGGHAALTGQPAPVGARREMGCRLGGNPIAEWQRHLQGLPVYRAGVRLAPADRSLYAAGVAKARGAGASMSAIAESIGCSFGLVRRLLESTGSLTDSTDSIEVRRVERVLRGRISDGTYGIGDALPKWDQLIEELASPVDAFRSAIARLEGQGIILNFNARGYVVTDPKAPPTGYTTQVRTRSGRVETWPLPDAPSRIRGLVTARIQDGTYPEGSKIPGNRALAKEFGITENLMRYLLRPLWAQGVLETAGPGRYSIVHPKARSLLESARAAQLSSSGRAVASLQPPSVERPEGCHPGQPAQLVTAGSTEVCSKPPPGRSPKENSRP